MKEKVAEGIWHFIEPKRSSLAQRLTCADNGISFLFAISSSVSYFKEYPVSENTRWKPTMLRTVQSEGWDDGHTVKELMFTASPATNDAFHKSICQLRSL